MSRPEPDYITGIRTVIEEAREVAWWFRMDGDTIDSRIADAFDRFADKLESKWL